jgi:hypothetical protein
MEMTGLIYIFIFFDKKASSFTPDIAITSTALYMGGSLFCLRFYLQILLLFEILNCYLVGKMVIFQSDLHFLNYYYFLFRCVLSQLQVWRNPVVALPSVVAVKLQSTQNVITALFHRFISHCCKFIIIFKKQYCE